MAEQTVYEKLAKHLDSGVVVGAPLSPSLLGILEILFPGEEAELGALLPMQHKTMAELKEMLPEWAERLEDLLPAMVSHGTVFTIQKPGQDRVYALMPSVVGWAETPYWAGRDTPEARKLAPLWLKYRNEAFAEELARGVPPVRVIPVGKSLRDESKIMPYDVIKDKIMNETSYAAVGNCPCRLMKKYVGQGCDHPLENCLHFGAMARYMVEQGLAREITREDAVEIVYQSDQAGLVHTIDNMEGHQGTVCNCCGCACVFLTTRRTLGHYTISNSNYLARVDPEACVGCGTCEERCPMEAVTLGAEDKAVVDETKCIGCGVCSPTCPTEAVRLEPRAETAPPPDLNEFLTRRYKA